MAAGPEWSCRGHHHYSVSRERCAIIIKNFFSACESRALVRFVQQFASAARDGDYHGHPPFIIHTLHRRCSLPTTLRFYWPTDAFLRRPPTTAATSSHCCHSVPSSDAPPRKSLKNRALSPLLQSGCRRLRLLILATLKNPTDRWLSAHPHPPAQFSKSGYTWIIIHLWPPSFELPPHSRRTHARPHAEEPSQIGPSPSSASARSKSSPSNLPSSTSSHLRYNGTYHPNQTSSERAPLSLPSPSRTPQRYCPTS